MKFSDIEETDYHELNLIKASYLQKMIRRGDVGRSLSIADMYKESGHVNALNRRLSQIWGEDISVANPELIIKLRNPDIEIDEKINLLCLSKKNREADRFLITYLYAINTINKSNKEIFREVAVLNKIIKLANSFYESKGKIKSNFKKELKESFSILNNKKRECIDFCLESYFELSKSKVHGARVMLSAAILIGLRDLKSKKEKFEIKKERSSIEEIPDYVTDIHTKTGRKIGKTIEDWAKEGAFVSNEMVVNGQFINSEEKYPLKKVVPFLSKKKRYPKK